MIVGPGSGIAASVVAFWGGKCRTTTVGSGGHSNWANDVDHSVRYQRTYSNLSSAPDLPSVLRPYC